MLSSRISLSVYAMALSGMVRLAWTSGNGSGVALAPKDSWLPLGICVVCAIGWWLNFSRDRKYHYLLSSRFVLSALSSIFSAFATSALVQFGIVRPVDLSSFSAMEYSAYVCGAIGLAMLWLTAYLRMRRLAVEQAGRASDEPSWGPTIT